MHVQSNVKTLEKGTTANTHAEVCQKLQGLNLLPLKTIDWDFESERRAKVACVNVFCARASACTWELPEPDAAQTAFRLVPFTTQNWAPSLLTF